MEILRGCLSIILLLALFVIWIVKKENNKNTIYIILLMVFVRFIFAIIRYQFNIGPDFPDEIFYEEKINIIANGTMLYGRYDVMNYIYIQAIARIIFGNTWLVSVFLNSILGSISIILIKDMFNENFEILGMCNKLNEKSIIVLIIMTMEPNILLYTNTLLRESLVLFLIILSVKYFMKYINYNKMKYIILYFILVVFVGVFRSVNMFIMVLVGIIILVAKNLKISLKSLIVIAIAFLTMSFCLKLLENKMYFSVDIKYINENLGRDMLGGGTMPYLVGERYENWIDLICKIPIRLIYFVLHPFPWIYNSYIHKIPVLTSIINLTCIFIIFKNIKYAIKIKKCKIIYLIVFVLLTLAFYSVAKSESANRHRLQFTWMLPLISCQLINLKYSNKKSVNILK